MNVRRLLISGAACLVLAGCSSGRTDSAGDPAPDAAGGEGAASACKDVELSATDTGITADSITIEIVADTGSAAIPGMANGAVEALEGWAKNINDEGGLACRQVKIRTFDSKIDPNESRSGMIDACENSFASVGDVMLAAADPTPLAECKDAKGAATGLPQIPATITNSLILCNPSTVNIAGVRNPCPPGKGKQTFTATSTTPDYVKAALGADKLTGFYNIGFSSPELLNTIMPSVQAYRDAGLAGGVHGARGSDPQTAYTAPAKKIKEAKAQFVFNNATFPSFTLLQSELKAQGVDVPMFICESTCYDPAYPKTAGDLATGTQIMLTYLPYEEADSNEAMKTFVDNVKTHNLFAIQSWVSAQLFQKAVEDVVAADGPNALTRASLLEAMDNVKDFTAGGLIGPTTPSSGAPATCAVFVEVQKDGTFKRTFPEKVGEFTCGDVTEVTVDPIAAFSS